MARAQPPAPGRRDRAAPWRRSGAGSRRAPRSCGASRNRRCRSAPACARTKSMTCRGRRSWPASRSRRFGRSKPCTNTAGSRRKSLSRMSARVAASAVAVNATVCTPPSVGLDGAERQIFRPEVVAPLRDAMGLVDRQQRDLGALEQLERVGLGQPLGRDVDEAKLAARDPVEDLPVLDEIVGRVQARGRDAVAAELRHLVAHQRDQRRHHDGEAVAQQRRQLVAQRLAAARRHDRQHVARRRARSRRSRAWPGRKSVEAERGAKTALRRREVGYLEPHQRCSIFVPGIRQPSNGQTSTLFPAPRSGEGGPCEAWWKGRGGEGWL